MKSILIVDDDPDIREAVVMALESRGYRVLAAVDGADCLAMLRAQERPALILVDLMMPGINGWDLCETIAADPKLRVPMVVLSGNTRAASHDLPIAAFIKKPVDLDTLVAIVEKNALSR